MTISRINGAGWGIGDKLTSAQMNGVDINTTYALDKRAGQTDTLRSVVNFQNGGRFTWSRTTAPTGTSYSVGVLDGFQYYEYGASHPNLSTVTLSIAGAQDGDVISFFCTTDFTYRVAIRNAALTTIFILGNRTSAYGAWVDCVFRGGDWVVESAERRFYFEKLSFTSDGSFVAPNGIVWALYDGFGGGAGGGYGAKDVAALQRGAGGGGGGGALRRTGNVFLFEGFTYDVEVGTGGNGGNSSSSVIAQAGGDTKLIQDSDASVQVLLRGAHYGQSGNKTSGTLTSEPSALMWNLGGAPVTYGSAFLFDPTPKEANYIGPSSAYQEAMKDLHRNQTPQAGQAGTTSNNLTQQFLGNPSPEGYIGGGLGGASNTNIGQYWSGGPGGGGGAGPAGNGGAGGNGGAPNNAGAGFAGGAGTSAAANTGAGGGGGGSAGGSSIGVGSGGFGGAGGKGLFDLLLLRQK